MSTTPLTSRPVTGPLVSAFRLDAVTPGETLEQFADRAATLVRSVPEADRNEVALWIQSETGVTVAL